METTSVETTPGLRERKRARTRSAIAEAALRLFEARGYAAVSVRDIALEAMVGERTLFRYFPDKAELLFADDLDVQHRLARTIRLGKPADAPAQLVRDALVELASLWADRQSEGRRRQHIVESSPELIARARMKHLAYEEVLTAALLEHGIDQRAARVVARAAVVCFDEAVTTWLDDTDPRRPGLATRVTETVDLLSDELSRSAGSRLPPDAGADRPPPSPLEKGPAGRSRHEPAGSPPSPAPPHS